MRSAGIVARWLALVVSIALVVSTAACIRAFDINRDGGPDTLDGTVDGPRPHSTRDGDLQLPDSTRDGPVDGPPALDVPSSDLRVDVPAKPDVMSSNDAKNVDANAVAACASGAALFTYSATMVICKGTAKRDQCGAHAACNAAAGWKLCSASQFASRGGATTPYNSGAWIAGCVRDGPSAAIGPPDNGVCSSCNPVTTSSETVAWRCTGTKSDTSNGSYIGLLAFNDCRRAGTNTATTGAYWRTAVTLELHDLSVCCR